MNPIFESCSTEQLKALKEAIKNNFRLVEKKGEIVEDYSSSFPLYQQLQRSAHEYITKSERIAGFSGKIPMFVTYGDIFYNLLVSELSDRSIKLFADARGLANP